MSDIDPKKVIEVNYSEQKARYVSAPIPNWTYKAAEQLLERMAKETGTVPLRMESFVQKAFTVFLESLAKQTGFYIVDPELTTLEDKLVKESDESVTTD